MQPRHNLPIKIAVIFERREDGGLPVYSDELPGLVRSHRDPIAALQQILFDT